MMALGLEFSKAKRRRLWLTPAVALALQMVWMIATVRQLKSEDMGEGWLQCIYQMQMLNVLIMPIALCVLASRACDVEHKGQAFRQLFTLMRPTRLFDGKLIYLAIWAVGISMAQLFMLLGIGASLELPDAPIALLLGHVVSVALVNTALALLFQIASLMFANQMVALCFGIVLGFAGFFALYFPQAVMHMAMPAYYALLSTVRMDWSPATRATRFYEIAPDGTSHVILVAAMAALYIAGRMWFSRREY